MSDAFICRRGGSGGANSISVYVDSGATVTAVHQSGKTYTAMSVDGIVTIKISDLGVYRVFATKDGLTTDEEVVEVMDSFPVEAVFGIRFNKLAVGTLLKLEENGVGVNYRVIHQGVPSEMYDESCDGTWVLREKISATGTFYNGAINNYASSRLHSYFNSTHLALFDDATQALIKQAKIPYVNGNGNSGSVASGANGLSTKIFALSGYEVGWTNSNNSYIPKDGACLSYFSGIAETDSKRIAYLDNGSLSNWWTRSPSKQNTENVLLVSSGGGIQYTAANSPVGIRPAMIFSHIAVAESTPNADGSYSLKL